MSKKTKKHIKKRSKPRVKVDTISLVEQGKETLAADITKKAMLSESKEIWPFP